MRRTIVVGLLVATAVTVLGSPGVAAGTWTWPVRGPIVRPFDPPASPYGAGHRGIDIGVAAGTLVVAPAPGVVSFAGHVAGQLFVSIDHGAGLVSTSSYLSVALVAEDESVVAGQPIGLSGAGHPGGTTAHLHVGVRLGGVYVDPLDYLAPISLVGILWLAPIGDPGVSPAPRVAPRALPWVAARLGSPLAPGSGGPIIVPPGSPFAGARPSPGHGRPVPA